MSAVEDFLHETARQQLAAQVTRTLQDGAAVIRDAQFVLPAIQRLKGQIPADQRDGLRNALLKLSEQCRDAATAL